MKLNLTALSDSELKSELSWQEYCHEEAQDTASLTAAHAAIRRCERELTRRERAAAETNRPSGWGAELAALRKIRHDLTHPQEWGYEGWPA